MSEQNLDDVETTSFHRSKKAIYLEKLRAVSTAGEKGSLEVGGKSWRVGLSTE